MTDVSFDLDVTEVNKAIDALQNPRKTAPLMDNLGRIVVSDTLLNFRAQSAPDGTPWEPTARGGQILRDTGRLRNSIAYETEGSDTVYIGTNLIYAAIHQFGGTIEAKNAPYLKFMVGGQFVQKRSVDIPARPFIGFESRQIDKINDAIETWMEALLG